MVVLFPQKNVPDKKTKAEVLHIPEKKITVAPKIQKMLAHEQCLKLAHDLQAFVMRIRLTPHSIDERDCRKMLKVLALVPKGGSSEKCFLTIKLHQKEVLVACR